MCIFSGSSTLLMNGFPIHVNDSIMVKNNKSLDIQSVAISQQNRKIRTFKTALKVTGKSHKYVSSEMCNFSTIEK